LFVVVCLSMVVVVPCHRGETRNM